MIITFLRGRGNRIHTSLLCRGSRVNNNVRSTSILCLWHPTKGQHNLIKLLSTMWVRCHTRHTGLELDKLTLLSCKSQHT